jgi:hypothetical protein
MCPCSCPTRIHFTFLPVPYFCSTLRVPSSLPEEPQWNDALTFYRFALYR